MWANYEIENGRVRVTQAPRTRKPVRYYVQAQGRFGHLDEDMVGCLQVFVDTKLAELGIEAPITVEDTASEELAD